MSTKWAISSHVYNLGIINLITSCSRLSMLCAHGNETLRSMVCQSFQYEYEFNIEDINDDYNLSVVEHGGHTQY